jgi:4-hydroxybenzoyl-CoA thioesterase
MSRPYVYSRLIQWGDTDAAKIVYTGRYLDYCLETIEGWFKETCQTNWYVLNVDRSTGTPFVNVNLDFKAPLTPRHTLQVELLVDRMGKSALSFKLTGKQNGEAIAFEARLTCCFVNNVEMKSIEIPDDIRTNIQGYIDACQP